MIELNKADKEIVQILKDTFLTPKNALISPDDHARNWILKSMLVLTILGVLVKCFLWFTGEESDALSAIVSTPAALFFGFLFLHLNAKSENSSLLLFGLTWVSLLFSLY